MLANLANLLPLLALTGLAIEAVPAAASKHGLQRHPRHKHAGLPKVARSGAVVRPQIRRRSDGTQCRVRPQASAAPSASAEADSVSSAAPSASAEADSASSAAPSASAEADTASSAAPAASAGADSASSAAPSASAQADSPSNGILAAAPSTDAGSTSSPAYQSASQAPSVDPTTSAAEPSATQDASAAAPSSTTAPVANSGSKYGAAWPNGDSAQPQDDNYITNYIGNDLSWYYTWSPENVGQADQCGLEFVPMLWGTSQTDDWDAKKDSFQSQGVKNLLFFNEPNEVGQASISAQDSVPIWLQHYAPLRAQGFRLGHAACSSAPSGKTWFQDFDRICKQQASNPADCEADFVPVHYYDITVDGFTNYVSDFHQTTGKPIWVTEYACQNFGDQSLGQCDQDKATAFHKDVKAWMDGTDYVERYSPFGMMEDMQGVTETNALMNSTGGITTLGQQYAGLLAF